MKKIVPAIAIVFLLCNHAVAETESQYAVVYGQTFGFGVRFDKAVYERTYVSGSLGFFGALVGIRYQHCFYQDAFCATALYDYGYALISGGDTLSVEKAQIPGVALSINFGDERFFEIGAYHVDFSDNGYNDDNDENRFSIAVVFKR